MCEKKIRMYKLSTGNSIGVELITDGMHVVGQTVENRKTITTEVNLSFEAAGMLINLIEARFKEKQEADDKAYMESKIAAEKAAERIAKEFSDMLIDKHNAEVTKRMNNLANVLKHAFGGEFANVEIVGISDMPCDCTNKKKKGK